MTPPFDTSAIQTIHHYLSQISGLLDLIAAEPEAEALLRVKLAPDMLDTGFNLAVAIGFAARALCLPAGVPFPEVPESPDLADLRSHHDKISQLIQPITLGELRSPVRHQAGQGALEQEVSDYILRFALPNMIFHVSIAYAALRQSGMQIGKADFDGLHVYT